MFVSLSRTRLLAAAFAIGSLCSHSAGAVTFFVGGNEAACTHHTLQAAVDALSDDSPSEIHVANSATYTEVALVVDSKNVRIIGGYALCSDATPSGRTVLDGANNGEHSVVRFSDETTATLQNFEIRNGHQGNDSHGGGINFTGHGSLTLNNDNVHDNECGFGAGLNVGPDGAATIAITGDTQITGNTATHDDTQDGEGGGIHIEGNTNLVVSGTSNLIWLNEAVNGGGLAVLAPAKATLSSGSAVPLLANNTATNGGGAYVGGSAALLLYSTSNAPFGVVNNVATGSGGGIALWGGAVLCANDYNVSGNLAPQGSAIDASGNSAVYLNNNLVGTCPTASGYVHCTAGTTCNAISQNVTEDPGTGTHTDGATIHLNSGSTLTGTWLQMRGNGGGNTLLDDNNDGETVSLTSCLLADNIDSGALVKTVDNSPISFANCTLAYNTVGHAYAMEFDDDYKIIDSILWHPNNQSATESDGNSVIVVQNTISHDIFGMGTDPTFTTITDPRFVDYAHGDYHLQVASPAVDYFAGTGGVDLDGMPRTVRLDLVPLGGPPRHAGATDLGAFERQDIGNLALDGGFDADLRLWNEVTADATAWDSSRDHAGDTGSGSAHVDVPRSATPVSGLTQCIHVPGPSGYDLDGYALAPGNISIGHDAPSLHWKLRYDSDTCVGTTNAEGDLNIPAGSPDWHHALAPALINVPANRWKATTTIEVTLVVAEGNITSGGDTAAWFDGISLVPHDADIIFQDGFDP